MPVGMDEAPRDNALSGPVLLAAQGLYYTATGVWPLIHIDSFQKVTGPKVDLWLVKTVGVLVAAVGGAFLAAAVRGRAPLELRLLAVASAAGLAAIDIVYSAKGRIPPIYLLDAAAEAALIAAWGRAEAAGAAGDRRDAGGRAAAG